MSSCERETASLLLDPDRLEPGEVLAREMLTGELFVTDCLVVKRLTGLVLEIRCLHSRAIFSMKAGVVEGVMRELDWVPAECRGSERTLEGTRRRYKSGLEMLERRVRSSLLEGGETDSKMMEGRRRSQRGSRDRP